MRAQQLLTAAAAILLMSAGAAYASTLTLNGSYTITDCSNCAGALNFPAYAPTYTGKVSFSTLLKNLGTEETLFTVNPASPGPLTKQVEGTVEVAFTFIELYNGIQVATGSYTQDATYQANYYSSGPHAGLPCSTSTGQTDCFYWNPLGSTLNPGGLSSPDGSTYTKTGEGDHRSTTPSEDPKITLTNGDSLVLDFYDAQDWSITPGISLNDLILTGRTTSLPTPIPATLPLFAGGLGMLGLLGRRRHKKPAATY